MTKNEPKDTKVLYIDACQYARNGKTGRTLDENATVSDRPREAARAGRYLHDLAQDSSWAGGQGPFRCNRRVACARRDGLVGSPDAFSGDWTGSTCRDAPSPVTQDEVPSEAAVGEFAEAFEPGPEMRAQRSGVVAGDIRHHAVE